MWCTPRRSAAGARRDVTRESVTVMRRDRRGSEIFGVETRAYCRSGRETESRAGLVLHVCRAVFFRRLASAGVRFVHTHLAHGVSRVCVCVSLDRTTAREGSRARRVHRRRGWHGGARRLRAEIAQRCPHACTARGQREARTPNHAHRHTRGSHDTTAGAPAPEVPEAGRGALVM